MIPLAGALGDLGVSARIADWWAEQNARRADWARSPVKTLAALRAGSKAQARAAAAVLADSVEPGGQSRPRSLGRSACPHPQLESRRRFAAELLARLLFRLSSFRSAVAAHGLRR
jgi:hypothetical protein